MANGQRGEISLTLGGTRYALVPSFRHLAEIEDRLGEGLIPLARRLAEGRVRAREVVTILHCALEWAGDRGGQGDPLPEEDDLAAVLIAEYGLARMLELASRLLAAFLGEDAAGEGPVPEKKSRPGRKPRGGG